MLSTLASKSGSFGRLALTQRCLPRLLIVTRPSSISSGQENLMKEEIDRWTKVNDIYYGKERDTKNFPIVPMPETGPPVKYGFIPPSLFTPFYEKTGVSGPYVFVGTIFLTLLSKEFLVVEHEILVAGGFCIGIPYFVTKVAPAINKHVGKFIENNTNWRYTKPMENVKAQINRVIEVGEKEIWRKEGQNYVFEAKKENIGLQLEATYRQRLHQVYSDVKRRLDYQLEIQNVQRRFQQENMVNWITKSVVQSITPQQEKESIANCIQTLKKISQTQAAV